MEKDEHLNWFAEFKKSEEYELFRKNPVAYFSAEYALDSDMPTYAGGLGILAGDHVREAAARDFPLVSVGLLYKESPNGKKLGENKKLRILKDTQGVEITVNLPMENRTVYARAWAWEDGEAKVFMLDTDLKQNDPRDRIITKELYSEDRDLRLKQEIMLGIGGFRLLAKLGFHPSVYHLNEGHSAFLALELVRHEMEHQHVNFHRACEFARRHLIFTNHTLVPAGQEKFSSKRVAELIEHCAMEICLNNWEIVKLGSVDNDPETYSMTNMSFRLSSRSNSVSKLHLEKAKDIWPEYNMEDITNGIFVARWDKTGDVAREEMWEKHLENKRKLLRLVREKTGETWGEEDLIFVWARRMVSYKQPMFLLDNLEKLAELIKNSPVPVRILYSGPATAENPFIEKIKKVAKDKLSGIVAFIPDYDTETAEILVSGADVWLNTPVVGNEACGTSGMKAGLNGALNLSTKDGWVGEVSGEDIGWTVNDCQSGTEMRALMGEKIIPLYVKHLKNPTDSAWAEKMLRVRKLIKERFSTTRMLREYTEKFYVPVMRQKHQHKID